MKKLLLKYWFIWLIGAGSFLSSLYAYAPYFVVEVKNPFIMTAKEWIEEPVRPVIQNNQKNLMIPGYENTALSIRITYSQKQPAKGSIILLHGIRSDKNSLIAQENYFSRQGFNTIAMDLRGHGNSQGEYCTYGFKEKKDVSALIDFILKKTDLQTPIGIFGHSLGGAVALQALAYDKRLEFGIIESSYSDFSKITSDYNDYYAGFSAELWTQDLLERSGKIAGFDPQKINPAESCKKITQAVFIAHGTEDQKVNPKYAKINFINLSSKKKVFYPVEKAHHNDVWETGGKAYHQAILHFIDQVISQEEKSQS